MNGEEGEDRAFRVQHSACVLMQSPVELGSALLLATRHSSARPV